MIPGISVNINFKKNKQLIFSSLYFVYYAVYAISPLLYTFEVKKIVDDTSGLSVTLNNSDVFLRQERHARIDPKKGDDRSSSRGMVLLRKARAVLPGNLNLKSAAKVNSVLSEDISSLFHAFSSGQLVLFIQRSYKFHFGPQHSGLSPPLV